MKQKAILSFCCITLVITTFLTSCDSAGGQVNNNNPEIVRQSASSVTETDINNSASCWVHSLDKSFGEWEGDGECTALARSLTDARGYGQDENGGFLGGADYVIQQQKKGIHIPLLAEIKSDIKPCDNLILVAPKYEKAGHTVVVFYPDLVNDKIYYLDQNYNGEGITPRSLRVSQNENSTYVISAKCNSNNQELIKCQARPIIAALGPPAQPELSTTLVSATAQAPSNNSSALTINGCKIEPYTQCEYANLPDASLSGAYLDNANLRHANLGGADLREADLREVDLSYANLIHADLAGASMVGADLIEADLREADLNGAHLGDAVLREADLRWATLTNAYLVDAEMEYANLTGADLSGANLHFAFLLRADLSYADLSEADLSEATLFRADLSGADLNGANLRDAKYDEETIWPSPFDPIAAGAVLESSSIYGG